jgi:hypothetical protein
MKNMNRLLVALIALVSASSMALVHPGKPADEDAPCRVSTALKAGIIQNTAGVGLSNAGVGIGFSQFIYGFEYGLAVAGDWAGLPQNRILGGGKAERENAGFLLDTELMLRFMPEVAERLNAGLHFGAGWNHLFGEKAKTYRQVKKISFGDFNFKLGIGLSYGFTPEVYIYTAPAVTLTSVHGYEDEAAKKAAKEAQEVNNWGAEIPLGFWFALADNAGLYIEGNLKMPNFKTIKNNWKTDVTLGLTFAI